MLELVREYLLKILSLTRRVCPSIAWIHATIKSVGSCCYCFKRYKRKVLVGVWRDRFEKEHGGVISQNSFVGA